MRTFPYRECARARARSRLYTLPVDVLSRPVQFLRGVGPKRARLLERLEISTLGDLLAYLPRTWENREETPPGRLPEDAPLVLRGRVTGTLEQRAGPHLTLFIAKLQVPGHGAVDALWFKRPSYRYDVFGKLKKDLTQGADVWVIGRGEPGLLKVRQIRVDHRSVQDIHRTGTILKA